MNTLPFLFLFYVNSRIFAHNVIISLKCLTSLRYFICSKKSGFNFNAVIIRKLNLLSLLHSHFYCRSYAFFSLDSIKWSVMSLLRISVGINFSISTILYDIFHNEKSVSFYLGKLWWPFKKLINNIQRSYWRGGIFLASVPLLRNSRVGRGNGMGT